MLARESTGFIGDVTSLAANGLRALRTRLELLAIELQEEKAWLVRFLVISIAALYLISFGTLLAILALSLAMPEASRPVVLGGFGGVFLAVGIGAVAWIVLAARGRQSVFQETLGVLARDEKSLRGPDGE